MSPDDAASRSVTSLWKTPGGQDIKALLPFANMGKPELQTLLDAATLQRIDANSKVFEEGDPAVNFYLLLEGTAMAVRTTSEGEQVILRHIMPGQLFGIAQAFEHETYRTTTRVIVAGLVLCWPADVWNRFSRDYPAFLLASRQAVGERFDDMREKLVAMATLKVDQRIAHAILGLVTRAGIARPQGIEIGFPITRQDISEMTGTTLHSVSRCMSKWEKSGIIASKRRRVTVCNVEELRNEPAH